MTMTKYDRALQEVRSVLGEWADLVRAGERIDSPYSRDIVTRKIVDRLVTKGVIQSTDEDDLREVRTGPLAPGRIVVGGDDRTHAERVAEAREWALTEHAETLRRLGEGVDDGEEG